MSENQKNRFCTFYIVRHGETEGNVKRVLQGHSDFPLTPKGIQDVQSLAVKFKDIRFDHIYSSDLLRAVRTAKIIAAERKLAIITKKILRERSFGRFEGKKFDSYNSELKSHIEKFEKLSEEQKFKFKLSADIESDEEIVSRILTFLREVAVAYPGKTVLIVSHGSIMRSLLIHLGFGTYQTLLSGAVKNLGYFVLDSDGSDFFVKRSDGIKLS